MTDKTVFAHIMMNKRDDEPTLQQIHAYAESMCEDIRHTENAFKVITQPFSRGTENVQAVIKSLLIASSRLRKLQGSFLPHSISTANVRNSSRSRRSQAKRHRIDGVDARRPSQF